MSHGTRPGQRAPSSKIGRNKTKCEKYRSRNTKEKNAERRMETYVNRVARRIQMRAALERHKCTCGTCAMVRKIEEYL